MTEEEEVHFVDFCNYVFKRPIESIPEAVDSDSDIISSMISRVDSSFKRAKYPLGLAIDFVALAEQVSQADTAYQPLSINEDSDDIFTKYNLVEKKNNKKSNTLTLEVGSSSASIRKVEERVSTTFVQMKRSGYPSAYVYNTGQWRKFLVLLEHAFRLSEGGRYLAIKALFEYGLSHFEKNVYYVRSVDRVRLFENFLNNYPRSHQSENGGLALQALSYGFLKTNYAHLSMMADKVRTGSSRQKRIGDIDLYYGLDLEISVEVKDMLIDDSSIEKQLSSFIESVRMEGTRGIVICSEISASSIEQLQQNGCSILTVSDVANAVSLWDWYKQDRAVHGFLHYLAHVEQDPLAVRRALNFIQAHDDKHSSLAFNLE